MVFNINIDFQKRYWRLRLDNNQFLFFCQVFLGFVGLKYQKYLTFFGLPQKGKKARFRVTPKNKAGLTFNPGFGKIEGQ
jgi:hypothetical protein